MSVDLADNVRADTEPILTARDLTIRFGGHIAVNGVNLDVHPGMVTGLIGPNGAGKTTTFNLLTGVLPPTNGGVALQGRDISRKKTHQRSRLGIARTFQRLEVFTSLTARENIQMGAEIRQTFTRGRSDPTEEVDRLLDQLGLAGVADVRVDELPTGQNRLIEIGRALAAQPKVLLLDEPASGLTDTETEDLGRFVRSLAELGMAILLVEHDMAMVMSLCDYVYVLDFGTLIAEGTTEAIQNNAAVQAAYLGSEAEA